MDSPPAGSLCIDLLGRFQVTVRGRAIEDTAWRRERAASLVKILALAPHHRLHREQVMELLWPDSAPGAGSNALHQVIHVARRILQAEEPVAPSPLHLRNEIVSLAPAESLWVDAEAFETGAALARQARDPIALESALDLYRGDLLPDDPYEEWTVTRRNALQQVYVETLLELAGIRAERKEYEKAIAALRRVVDTEPAHEEAHAALMRVYALAGQRYSALRQYRVLQNALSRELGA